MKLSIILVSLLPITITIIADVKSIIKNEDLTSDNNKVAILIAMAIAITVMLINFNII